VAFKCVAQGSLDMENYQLDIDEEEHPIKDESNDKVQICNCGS